MSDAVEIVRLLGGVATFGQVVDHAPRSSLRRAHASGELRRLRRGVYGLPELPSPRRIVAMTRGVLSHTSAARIHGLDVPAADRTVHVTVTPGARAVPRTTVSTHWSPLTDEDVEGFVTSPVRTVLDCAMSLPFVQALAVADSALRTLLVTRGELLRAAEARRGAGRSACLAVARAADGRARNGFESLVRGTFLEAGVSDLVPQHAVELPGFTAHVDLADVARQIAAEADSYTYHATREAFGRDCERYDELVAAGWLVQRFTWEQAALRSAWMLDVFLRTRALRRPAA